ncbi:major facilitator superfamily domain-containing protein [Xylaria bambusicola]|uniref:major facilitator superfamily domain-containing protein n=1 Tax=Xylaria bambusicola TaxID=326684 RepID=UPI002008E7A1|nr:major facilitator superfamily domain-containing protein [Xylaria bambusicola]KAI0514873.1 major facilitator superfamily domain-containing protein [Xylaria bambusicola]
MTQPENKVEEEDIDSKDVAKDPTKAEKKTRDEDEATEVDDTSTIGSTSSSWEEDRRPSSHPASRPLSHAISESEIRDGFQNQRDPELGPPLTEKVDTTAPNPDDPNLVTWTGPDDPENPKNWPFSKKWAAVFTVSLFTLISPISSSLVAPALESIAEELKIEQAFEKNLTLSIFILAYAIGPLVWGPLSELYGRVLVLQLVNLLYLFFNLGCGLARTKEQLIAFRFLAGLGGSAPLAIGGGVLSDLFTAENRGKALSIYSLAPLLGPAIGPIAGAFIAQNTTWRWAFYATTIADALIQGAGVFFLKETYAPLLLVWKKRRLVKETGNTDLHTPYDNPNRTVAKTLRIALERPFRMITTQIIVQVLAVYMLYVYGLIYIVLTSFPVLFSGPEPDGYGEPVGIGGLNYISLGLGFFVGAQVTAPLQDRIYVALKKKYGGIGRPEYRVPMLIPGAILMPIGLIVYGWTAEFKTHWIFPNIGAFLFSTATIISFQCLQTYLVDTYTRYAASAVSAGTVFRSLAGFGFPLFAPSLYETLGNGWGNTLLALLGVVLGWPAPFLLWKYGEKLRMRSPFAAGDK